MSPFRLFILLSCTLALLNITACTAPQPLSDQEKSASIERLEKLKRQLAALKSELAETRMREQQAKNVPNLPAPQALAQPAWIFRIGTNPLPAGYSHHATLLTGKQPTPQAVDRVVELIMSLQLNPASRSNDRTLFIIPALSRANLSFSFEDYDQQQADESLRGWPGSVADVGPYLLIEPGDATSGNTGRLLINLNGLQDAELGNLLQSLQWVSARSATELLTTLLRERQGKAASVTSLGDDFSLGWPR